MVVRSPAAKPLALDQDHVVAIHGVSWRQYELITKAIGDSPSPRTTYLEGELNLMSPGRAHEYLKKLIARLIEAFAEERDLQVNGFGGETLRARLRDAGCEPDECYSVGHAGRVPDLAIEIVITSGTIDKLEVYARIGCREVWFWKDGRIEVYSLERDGAYKRRRGSRILRGFPLAEVERILDTADPANQTEVVKAFRRSLRED